MPYVCEFPLASQKKQLVETLGTSWHVHSFYDVLTVQNAQGPQLIVFPVSSDSDLFDIDADKPGLKLSDPIC